MMTEDPYALLRELLAKTPSQSSFLEILNLLHEWEGDAASAISYAQEHLEGWPDELRRVEDVTWCERPTAPLIRTLEPPPQKLWFDELDAFLAHDFRHITRLNMDRNELGSDGFARLIKVPSLAGLHRLGMVQNEISGYSKKVLTSRHVLKELRELDLSSNGFVFEGKEARTLKTMKFPKLEWLSLDNNQLSKEGLEALASNPHLAGLRYLDLSRNWIESDWLAPLLASPHMAGLKTLLFYSNSIKEDGMDAFAHATMSGLEVLDLSSNYLHPEGAAKLASVSCFPELVSLNLAGSWVEGEGAIAFGKTEHFPKLKHLHVGRNYEEYSSEALQAWLDFCAKRGVETLDLGFAKLSGGAAEQIALCEGLSSLRTLVLSGCSIGDEGARSLAKASHLEGLGVLELSHNGISEDGEALVREAPQFQNTDIRIE